MIRRVLLSSFDKNKQVSLMHFNVTMILEARASRPRKLKKFPHNKNSSK